MAGITPPLGANDSTVVHLAGVETVTGVKTFTGATTTISGGLVGTAVDAAVSALKLTPAAASTAPTLDIRNSADVAQMSFTAAGLLRWVAAGNEQTTVGAAGGASALPATPTKFLKVVDSSGATLVVPAYLAS